MKLNKSKLNLSIDIIMFLVMLLIAGMGFLIKFVLVPGYKRNELYGKDVELFYFGLDRHEWGSIHLLLGFIFLFLLCLHLIFHWKQIVSIFKRMVASKPLRIVLVNLVLVLSLLFLFAPFVVKPLAVPQIHHALQAKAKAPERIIVMVDSCEPKHETNLQGRHNNRHAMQNVEIYGSMTLQQVADKYDIPAAKIAGEFNIPLTYRTEKLGRLRKRYTFRMGELKQFIESEKSKP